MKDFKTKIEELNKEESKVMNLIENCSVCKEKDGIGPCQSHGYWSVRLHTKRSLLNELRAEAIEEVKELKLSLGSDSEKKDFMKETRLLKIMRKDKIPLKKYNRIEAKAMNNITEAKDDDVLYLIIKIEIPFKMTILQAEVVNMEVFEKLLRYGKYLPTDNDVVSIECLSKKFLIDYLKQKWNF